MLEPPPALPPPLPPATHTCAVHTLLDIVQSEHVFAFFPHTVLLAPDLQSPFESQQPEQLSVLHGALEPLHWKKTTEPAVRATAKASVRSRAFMGSRAYHGPARERICAAEQTLCCLAVSLDDPEQLGRYQLDRKLGAGGMAEVFLARQRGTDGAEKACVVKRMLPGLSEDTSYVQMFLDEARVAARLVHPGIVQIYDFGKEGETYFIAMEYISGASLQMVLEALRSRATPVPVPVAAKLTSLVATALDHAHRATDDQGKPLKIIHRDVSPHNIMLSSKGEVKLIDFGIAKAADAFHRTEVGTLKGKFAYMAPEQLNHLMVDHRADLYSLGLVLYELLAGIPAVQGGSHASVLAAAHRRQYTPLEKLRPMTPAALRAILDKALASQPQDRFQTAAEMAQALEDFLVSSGSRVKQGDLSELLLQATDLTPLENQAVVKTAITSDRGARVDFNSDQPTTLPADGSTRAMRLDEGVAPTRLSSRPDGVKAPLPHEETVPTDPVRIAPDIQAVLRKSLERETAPDLLAPTDPVRPAPDIEAAMARPPRNKSIPPGLTPAAPAAPIVGGAALGEPPTTPERPTTFDRPATAYNPNSTAVVMAMAFPKKRLWPRALLVLVLLFVVAVELIIVVDAAAPARAVIRERLGGPLQSAGLLHFFEEKK
jgi:serine/threonine-protein kinase